jgi:hypothetical protein
MEKSILSIFICIKVVILNLTQIYIGEFIDINLYLNPVNPCQIYKKKKIQIFFAFISK